MANKVLLITSLLTMIASGNCPYKSSDPGIPGTELNMIHQDFIDQNLKDTVDPGELMQIHIEVQRMLDSNQYVLGQFNDGQGNLYTILVQNFEELQSETEKLTPSGFKKKMDNYKSSWCEFFKKMNFSFAQKIQAILSICGFFRLVNKTFCTAIYIKDNLLGLKNQINNLLKKTDVRPSTKNQDLELAKQNITDAINLKKLLQIDERVLKLLRENPHKENLPVPRFFNYEAMEMNDDEINVGINEDKEGHAFDVFRFSNGKKTTLGGGGKRKTTKRRKQSKKKTKRRKSTYKRRRTSYRKR